MTDGELAILLSESPTLFHMAERGSWESIRKHGLLSTSALLDLLNVTGETRSSIESARRPQNVQLEHPTVGTVVIRDNKPMDDKGLSRALNDGLEPKDWYELLNHRVFFWLTRDRLVRLLSAGPYVAYEHDVLEVDAAKLVGAYKDEIELAPINTGCTKPFPHPRGKDTFLTIPSYPYADWAKKRKRGERAVELTIPYSVPDIEHYVTRVVRMKGPEELGVLFT